MATDAGKIFASIMGFVSVGAVAVALVFTLGPMLMDLWREGLDRVEGGARVIEKEFAGRRDKDKEKSSTPPLADRPDFSERRVEAEMEAA